MKKINSFNSNSQIIKGTTHKNSVNEDDKIEFSLKPPYIKLSSLDGIAKIKSKVTDYYKDVMAKYKAEQEKAKKEMLFNEAKVTQPRMTLPNEIRQSEIIHSTAVNVSDTNINSNAQLISEPLITPLEKILKGLTESVTAKKINNNYTISVTPNGNVNIGWGCTAYFKAIRTSGIAFHHFWWIVSYEPQLEFYYLGPTQHYKKINFPSEWIYYSLSALAGQNNGKAKFFVRCDTYDIGGNYIATERSQDILMEFGQIPCLELHSLSPTEVSIKGGDHGTNPNVLITLNVPAPPGGQIVYLSTNNSNIAWINSGFEQIVIPAGQQSTEISGFLGTKNVHINRETLLVFAINGKQGYVNLKVNK